MGRYVAPFVVFGLLTECQRFGTEQTIFWIYALKTVATAACIVFCFKGYWKEIPGKFDAFAIVLGLIVLGIWILPDLIFDRDHTITFNPEVFDSGLLAILAISFRMMGASVVVPVMEELLWRSFLMRWLIKKDFLAVPIGTYAHLSFFGTVVAFTSVHHIWEWPMTLTTGILYGGYLVKTKNLKGCILAHATTNFGLGCYVLVTKQWFYW